MERKSCTNKTIQTNNYSVLNAEKSLNFQQKIKNFTQQKVTHLQKDALSAVKTEKQEATIQEAAAVAAASAEKEKNTL